MLRTKLASRLLARAALTRSAGCAPIAVTRVAASTLRFQIRSFSDDTHDDFKPVRKNVSVSDETASIGDRIDKAVKSIPVLLFMKGNPSAPQCGFSRQVAHILQEQGVAFQSVDVLSDPEVRQGIKDYSKWPTIPQLYVEGEFIGGCDIVTQMYQNGELSELLAKFKK